MPKTRASFHIAEDDRPLRKRPRRSCNATGVLEELDNNVPQQPKKRGRPKLKSKESEDNAPRSRSKRAANDDETPKRRKLPKRKGRGVPPLRLQDEIMGDEEDEEDEDDDEDDVADDAPRRRSSARIQMQSTDKPTEPKQSDRPDKRRKNEIAKGAETWRQK